MRAYIKNFAAMRTQRALDVVSSSMCLDSAEQEASTVTVTAADVTRDNAGNWLVLDGNVWMIEQIVPEEGRTLIQCISPIDAFSRQLVYSQPPEGTTIGEWIFQTLASGWRDQQDGVYAMPYMDIENADTSPFAAPVLDDKGLFRLSDYMRQVWRLNNVKTVFSLSGDTLKVRISKVIRSSRNIVFTDGHSQLETAAYSRSGVAKITAIQAGTVTDWYLSEDGVASTVIPDRRASGTWEVITLSDREDQAEKVRAAFSKNSESHKIEFWSDKLFSVYDNISIRLNGELIRSNISYVGIRSTDNRYFYKAGALPVTAAEKLKTALVK